MLTANENLTGSEAMFIYAEDGVEVGRMETDEAAKLAYPLEYGFIESHPSAIYVKWNSEGKECCLMYCIYEGVHLVDYCAGRGVKAAWYPTEPTKTQPQAIKYSPAVEARRQAARRRDAEEAAYDKWVTDQAEAYNLAQVCDDGTPIIQIDPK